MADLGLTAVDNKTQILLVRPDGYDDGKTSLPYGIISIAKYLQARGICAAVADAYREETTANSIAQTIAQNHIPWLGISALSVQIPAAREIVEAVRRCAPETRIIIGGVHVTARPEDGLEFGQVIRGPGESTVASLLAGEPGFDEKQLQGVPLHEYDYNPLPDLATMRALTLTPPSATFSIMTARGCPFACNFCLGREQRETRVTYYPLDNVMQLIRDAWELGYRKFFISDDVFFLDRNRVTEFCDRIDALGINPRFRAFTHAKIRDTELYARARRSGFTNLALGVESGNNEILKIIGKNVTVAEIEDCVRAIMQAGIDVSCLYMAGNPGEDEAKISDTIALAHRLHRRHGCSSWFSIAQPFPGTVFRKEADQYGKILHSDFSRYNNTGISFLPRDLTEKQLWRLWRKGLIYGNRGPISAFARYAVYRLFGR